MKKIDGQKLANKIKDQVAKEIYDMKGPRPNLAIILATDREDSKLYVSLKEKEGYKVGIDTHVYVMTDNCQEEEILKTITFLNNDPIIDGILVQLPLSLGINTDKVISAISPEKDVDGFRQDHPEYVVPPVVASVLCILENIKYDISDKEVGILYNSEIFGNSLAEPLKKLGAHINMLSVGQYTPEKYEDIKSIGQKSDVLITALGQPQIIKGDAVKKDALVIDIGISKVDGKVVGDVDFKAVKNIVSYITPVPGGIGPMTIAFLFKNTLEIFKRRNKK
jgi:methylenetetrahydrofolate dehydrogenase (NADP+)/methenyltetrahydrofolate cyclohydrolase